MQKRQLVSPQPDQTKQRVEVPDVPSVGTPAPPIDPREVPGLLEKPKIKRKNRSFTPAIIIALIVAMVVLGVVSTIIVRRHSSSVVVVVGDGRIEPPSSLPTDTTPKGIVSALWQPRDLELFAWDTWAIKVSANDKIDISVNAISDNFTPILGVYDSDGKLIAAATNRTDPNKVLTYTFTHTGAYTILVSNIGGGSGKYEIRAQHVE